jgi:hypothetical protein
MTDPFNPSEQPLPRSSFTLLQSQDARLKWRGDTVLHFQARPTRELETIHVAPFMVAARGHLTQIEGATAPLLIDRSRPWSSTFRAKTQFAEWAAGHLSAIAWWAPTRMARLAAVTTRGLYELHGLSHLRMRIFATEEDALMWLIRTEDTRPAERLAENFSGEQ